MAYAEKRGRTIRARFKLPSGLWDQSAVDDNGNPFPTKQAAEDWGNDQEAKMRLGLWIDPRKGEVTLDAWIELWWQAQDLEDTTMPRYRYLIDHHILPKFGERPIKSLDSREEIAGWEIQVRKTPKLVGTGTYAPRTALDARSLLATILGDAKVAGLTTVNVAEKQRGRGRKRTRNQRKPRRQEKVWVDPFTALLVAERCALASGRDEEFVFVVDLAFTGKRWGEAIATEESQFTPGAYQLDWQIKEVGGRFSKAPPKDDSRRPLDVPPFLTGLYARLIEGRATGQCSCPGNECDGDGRYLYLTAGEPSKNPALHRGPSHYRRSDFASSFWHPAVAGFYPAVGGQRPRPQKPVLVDGMTGRPLLPAWPYAEPGAVVFEPPRGRGWRRHDAVDETAVRCPSCRVEMGHSCVSRSGVSTKAHQDRVLRAEKLGVGSAGLVMWLPLAPGLVRHGLRHSHQTWMVEGGIEEVLRAERMGHTLSGIQHLYTHISRAMRAKLIALLEHLWADALLQRARLDRDAGRVPHSSVRVLDELLEPFRRGLEIYPGDGPLEIISQPSPRTTEAAPSVMEGTASELGGRYWVRTSDLFGVNSDHPLSDQHRK